MEADARETFLSQAVEWQESLASLRFRARGERVWHSSENGSDLDLSLVSRALDRCDRHASPGTAVWSRLRASKPTREPLRLTDSTQSGQPRNRPSEKALMPGVLSQQSSVASNLRYPNDAGFDTTPETRTPVELKIEGTIPAYVHGSLYRTGPGRYDLATKNGNKDISMSHWFDGYTMNHHFKIGENTVEYSSRYSCDALMEDTVRNGHSEFTFAQPRDPCESLFHKVGTIFSRSPARNSPSGENTGVTISHSSQGKLIARTDANRLQELDPETLEPVDSTCYDSIVQGQLSAAHGVSDPLTGEYFNYTLEMKNSRYTVFKVLRTGETVPLTKINTAKASYIHAIALTQNYVILTVWQAYITHGLKILWNRNILDSITKEWDNTSMAEIYVIPRSGGPAKLYKAPDAFFCFHIINSYEEDGGIVLDLVRWDDHRVLTEFYVKHLSSASPEVKMVNDRAAAHVMRYHIQDISKASTTHTQTAAKELSFESMRPANIELPIINPAYHMKQHRYVYGIHNQVSSLADSIVKIDLLTKSWTVWSDYPEAYSSPGEPIFVADPDSTEEDGGVLLTVVLDGGKRKSSLVVLDARSMKVVARAHMDTSVSFGFHGSFANRFHE